MVEKVGANDFLPGGTRYAAMMVQDHLRQHAEERQAQSYAE